MILRVAVWSPHDLPFLKPAWFSHSSSLTPLRSLSKMMWLNTLTGVYSSIVVEVSGSACRASAEISSGPAALPHCLDGLLHLRFCWVGTVDVNCVYGWWDVHLLRTFTSLFAVSYCLWAAALFALVLLLISVTLLTSFLQFSSMCLLITKVYGLLFSSPLLLGMPPSICVSGCSNALPLICALFLAGLAEPIL